MTTMEGKAKPLRVLIAEDSDDERDALALESCDLLQGYLFAKPDRGFPAPRW
jgi:EAL domain-containing protein (putative c-di-GMP-specific phosphodiesterase class I)